MAAAATADSIPGRLALLPDSTEGRSYLVDTGSAYSILPFSSTAQYIKAWGRRVQISTGGQHFIWRFLQAEVAFSIIGADFLANFKMAVDLWSMQLLCPAGSTGGATCRQPHSSSHRGGGFPLNTFTSHSGGTFLFSYC